MSTVDWIGYFVAVAICLAIGAWLHRVNKKPDETRTEALAIGFGWLGVADVLFQHWAQTGSLFPLT
ncbi:MAG TPA: hypothetical protein VLC71_06080 [Thermomonas sp.]|nr:hypothetical protein [Thermomonas sp.]